MYIDRTKGFTQINNEIIFDSRVSNGEFRTYVLLKSFKFGSKGKSFPSQQTVASLVDQTRETVNMHVGRLIKLGYISAKRRGYSSSNEYCFICDNNLTNDSNKNITSSVRKNSYHMLDNRHTNNTKENNTETNNIDFKVTHNGLKKVLENNPFLKNKMKEVRMKSKMSIS
ncbi:MAG: hypothetical protein ABIJ43_04800 [Candidatus Beckwithbacteria bacterium]